VGGWLLGFEIGGKKGGVTLCQLGRGVLLWVEAEAGHLRVTERGGVSDSVGVVGGGRFEPVVGRFARGAGGGGGEVAEERGVSFGGREWKSMCSLVGYMAESEVVEFPMLYLRLEVMKVGVALHQNTLPVDSFLVHLYSPLVVAASAAVEH